MYKVELTTALPFCPGERHSNGYLYIVEESDQPMSSKFFQLQVLRDSIYVSLKFIYNIVPVYFVSAKAVALLSSVGNTLTGGESFKYICSLHSL